MKIKFWGVRGSIPVPGPRTVRYGGNTTCIEVRTDAGHLIILDAGTGIFQLGQMLLKELPVKVNIFITHTHWDHIQGLPFFVPLYIPGSVVRLHGAEDILTGRNIGHVLDSQLQYSYFPVREAELKAGLESISVANGVPIEIGDATVTPVLLNHPVTNFGYRIACNGKSVFFTGDHEPWMNIYAPEDEDYNDFQGMVVQRQREMDAALGPLDVLIADSAYTPEEYPPKVGWGHGTFDSNILLADRIGAKRLFCTHHEPTRSDDDIDRVFAEALARQPRGPGLSEVELALEGLEIVV